MRRGVFCSSSILLLAMVMGVGAFAQCPQVTVPIIQENFVNWPPPGWSLIGNYPFDCPWDSNTNLGMPNYTGGATNAATASSLNCTDQNGFIRELMHPPTTFMGFPVSLDLSFSTDWEPNCDSAAVRTEASLPSGWVVFKLGNQSPTYPLYMPSCSSYTGTQSVNLATYPDRQAFTFGFTYEDQTYDTSSWWQVDNVLVTATYNVCGFDMGFQDDFGRSEVCVLWDLAQSNTAAAVTQKPSNGVQGPTFGAFAYRILSGKGAGNAYFGWATVQYGPGYNRMTVGPGQGMQLTLVYYPNTHRATAAFTDLSTLTYSSLFDGNTLNDEVYCGLNGKGSPNN